MTKVPCTKCGVSILETTARKNNGLCAPCKSGTREAIEAAKQWYKEERERDLYDPFRKLWQELVRRKDETPEGFAEFSDAEKKYFAVVLLEGEVYNGGFDQYFHNHSGSYYLHALSGLEVIGARRSLSLLEQAKEVLFKFREVPESTEVRCEFLLKHDSDIKAEMLEHLDSMFCKDPDELALRLEKFAREHGLVSAT